MTIRRETLLDAIGDIDSALIEEAAPGARWQRTGAHRRGWAAAAACLVLLLAACVPALYAVLAPTSGDLHASGDLQPMIFVDGALYAIAAEEPDETCPSGSVYLGEIASAVGPDACPDEELQANDPELVGAAVYRDGDDLLVCIDGQYWRYERMPG